MSHEPQHRKTIFYRLVDIALLDCHSYSTKPHPSKRTPEIMYRMSCRSHTFILVVTFMLQFKVKIPLSAPGGKLLPRRLILLEPFRDKPLLRIR